MKMIKKISKYLLMLVLALCLFQTASAETMYEITFRAGNHGTIYGENKLVVERAFDEDFPNEPDVTPDEGYVFVGWSEAFPETVEGKETYVAKYRKVISGQELVIRYVDQNGVDIITPRIRLVEKGSVVDVNAFDINGWPVDQEVKSITIEEGKNEVRFVYTVPADKIQIEYAYNEIIQYIDRVVNMSSSVPASPNQQGTVEAETEEVTAEKPSQPEQNQPTVDIEEEETPLAPGIDEKQPSFLSNYLMIGAGVVVLVGILLFFLMKKRKEQ